MYNVRDRLREEDRLRRAEEDRLRREAAQRFDRGKHFTYGYVRDPISGGAQPVPMPDYDKLDEETKYGRKI